MDSLEHKENCSKQRFEEERMNSLKGKVEEQKKKQNSGFEVGKRQDRGCIIE